MNAPIPDIELTADEQELFAQISLDPAELETMTALARNGDAVSALMKSLISRDAIPASRKNWFTDPHFDPGNWGKSRRKIFEKIGTGGEEILRDPAFLEYLRYFVCGSRLPDAIRRDFRDRVAACGTVSASDVLPLRQCARDLTRWQGLNVHEASKEFYRLALDYGLSPGYAMSIGRAVTETRRAR